MADLSDVQAAGSTKIIGSDSTGLESTPVNSTANGALYVNLRDSAGSESGTSGNPLRVELADGTKNTYSAAIITSNLASSTTDFFTITGSSTKTVRITAIYCGFTGGGKVISVHLLKRSSANSGGTSTTLTQVPHDSANPAATSTVRIYTANPSGLGTLVGAIRADRTNSPLSSSTTNPEDIIYEFSTRGCQAIVLRGAQEVLAFNMNGDTLSGGAVTAFVEWTEE